MCVCVCACLGESLNLTITSIPYVHSISFNISVILGPPVGRAKFGISCLIPNSTH